MTIREPMLKTWQPSATITKRPQPMTRFVDVPDPDAEFETETPARPIYTVIAPIHNEESVLPELYRRVSNVLNVYTQNWELILVDDGSRDRSAAVIFDLREADPRVKGIKLARNFGFQVAVTAGLEHAQGDATILMDGDLQDPPEVISDMIAQWKQGNDVVYGVRSRRAGETWFKKTTAHAFYRVIQRITNVDIPVDTGDSRLMDRRVVEALLQMPERHRFLRGMVSWVGFKQTGVQYDRQPRFAGETKFSLRKMVQFALDAITSFSYFPLQLASYIGFAMAAISGLCILLVIVLRLFGSSAPLLGQATTLVTVLFLGSVQLICLGIIGEYLGRIYDEVKQRPLYLVDQTWGV